MAQPPAANPPLPPYPPAPVPPAPAPIPQPLPNLPPPPPLNIETFHIDMLYAPFLASLNGHNVIGDPAIVAGNLVRRLSESRNRDSVDILLHVNERLGLELRSFVSALRMLSIILGVDDEPNKFTRWTYAMACLAIATIGHQGFRPDMSRFPELLHNYEDIEFGMLVLLADAEINGIK